MHIRPSEPFLTPYLVETKNLTKISVYNEIYPVWSYSQLPIFIFVLASTDILKFRPIIWVGAIGYVATWIILIFGKSVQIMELMQVTYAIGTACEVAYKSYVFVGVPRFMYSTVSLYMSAVSLLGRSLSSLASQLLHDFLNVSFLLLNYISLGSVTIAFIISWFIPEPQYRNRGSMLEVQNPDEDGTDMVPCNRKYKTGIKHKIRNILSNIKVSYRSRSARRWAYWGIVTSAVYFMVGNTSQSLWKDLEKGYEKRYNGYIIALNALLSSLTSYTLGCLSKVVERTKGSVIAILVLIMSVTTLVPTILQNLYLAYLCDALFNILVSSAITISTFKMAHSLTNDLYGFVVGINACIAGMIDLLVTLVIADERVLGFSPRQQYFVYTGFSVCAALIYLFYKCVTFVKRRSVSIAATLRVDGYVPISGEEDESDSSRKILIRSLDNDGFSESDGCGYDEDDNTIESNSDCEILPHV